MSEKRKDGTPSNDPAPQNRGQIPPRAQKPKRRQGGPGRPFPKGQPDAIPGKDNRFKPGNRANPGGRPKTLREMRERIQARGVELVDALFDIVDKEPEMVPGEHGGVVVGPSHHDRIMAIRELLHTGYGRPTQAVEVSGPGGGPIPTSPVENWTSEQKAKRLAELFESAKQAKAKQEPPTDGGTG